MNGNGRAKLCRELKSSVTVEPTYIKKRLAHRRQQMERKDRVAGNSAELLKIWLQAIHGVSTVPQLLEVANSFATQWSAEELLRLPAQCRPRKVNSLDELLEFSVAVADCYRASQNDERDRWPMSAIFTFAEAVVAKATRLPRT